MKRYLISLNGTFVKEYTTEIRAKHGFLKIIESRMNISDQSILLVDKLDDYKTICEFYS